MLLKCVRTSIHPKNCDCLHLLFICNITVFLQIKILIAQKYSLYLRTENINYTQKIRISRKRCCLPCYGSLFLCPRTESNIYPFHIQLPAGLTPRPARENGASSKTLPFTTHVNGNMPPSRKAERKPPSPYEAAKKPCNWKSASGTTPFAPSLSIKERHRSTGCGTAQETSFLTCRLTTRRRNHAVTGKTASH